MKNLRAWALLGFFLCWSYISFAQQQYDFRFRNDVKIVIDSDTVKNPGAGGLNSPVFSKIDLNQDGTEDLFVFDRTHNKIFTFLAKATNNQWAWQYAPEYEYLFPHDLSGWVLLRDYDQDGHRDLFTQTNLGIKVYRNTTGQDGKLNFTVAANYITFNNSINLQIASMPAIVDMDNDGDLDILTYDFSTLSTLEYYKNLQKEENLPAATLKYTQEKANWGNLKKCEHLCNGYVFNGNCRTTGTLHNDGVSLLALDLDGDGDKDLLLGGDGCPDLVNVTNSGTPIQEAMSGSNLQVNFPENTTRASFNQYPTAYYEDVDFDQKPDLIVAPFAEANTADNINFMASAWLYKNNGTATSPTFAFQQNNFLQADMVDVGENSVPALVDVDADGDADLLVGNRQGSIWFFRNEGTRSRPVFKKETTDYLSLAASGFRDVKPQFTDLNGDGKPDLILTVTTGTTGAIKYMLNTAGANQAMTFLVAQIKTLPVTLPVGSVPAFYDLDKDGDKDLILASSTVNSATSGALLFYRNTGTAANPTYTLVTDSWGNIATEFSRRNNFPLLADLNQDQDPELILGDDSGELRVYSNAVQHLNDSLIAVSDLFLRPNTDIFEKAKLGGSISLAAADLDGDQKTEIIVGSRGGGLYFLTQQSRGVLGNDDPVAPVPLTIYPNPAVTEWVTIQSPEEIKFSIYTITKKQIMLNPEFDKIHQVNVADLTPCMYLVQVSTADARQASYKLIIPR